MNLFVTYLEIIGTISFAISGAITGIKKNMDIFGVCILGITTSVGGGIMRDIILGITPPSIFIDPTIVLVAIGVSILCFLPFVRKFFSTNHRLYEISMLLFDSAGLGIFTVCGAEVAISSGYAENAFLTIFIAVLTGVGGGVIRDIFAGDRPYIFIKHIYACAALLGAIVCTMLWNTLGSNISMLLGFVLIVVIRLFAAKFHWSLPKAK